MAGALTVLPTWLAVLLLIKALVHLEVIVKPVMKHLPEDVGHPLIFALLLLIVVCLFFGAILRTTIGR